MNLNELHSLELTLDPVSLLKLILLNLLHSDENRPEVLAHLALRALRKITVSNGNIDVWGNSDVIIPYSRLKEYISDHQPASLVGAQIVWAASTPSSIVPQSILLDNGMGALAALFHVCFWRSNIWTEPSALPSSPLSDAYINNYDTLNEANGGFEHINSIQLLSNQARSLLKCEYSDIWMRSVKLCSEILSVLPFLSQRRQDVGSFALEIQQVSRISTYLQTLLLALQERRSVHGIKHIDTSRAKQLSLHNSALLNCKGSPCPQPPSLPSDNKKNISLLLIHAHYTTGLREILLFVLQCNIPVDILITTSSLSIHETVQNLIKELRLNSLGRTAVCRLITNRGRDIGAMLQLGSVAFSGYELVAKIHIKKSPHLNSNIGDRWSTYLLQSVLFELAHLKRVIYLFKVNPMLGIWAPLPMEGTSNNDYSINQYGALSVATNCSFSRSQFNSILKKKLLYPSGTMFFFRPEALSKLLTSGLFRSLPPEPIPSDGSVVHAIERLLPLFASEAGFCTRYYSPLTTRSTSPAFIEYIKFCIKPDGDKIVLITHETSNSGAPRVVLTLARELRRQNRPVCIIALAGGDLLPEFIDEENFFLFDHSVSSREYISRGFSSLDSSSLIIGNTILSSQVILEAKRHGLRTISLIHEDPKSGLFPLSLFRDSLEADVSVVATDRLKANILEECSYDPRDWNYLHVAPQPFYHDIYPSLDGAEANRLIRKKYGISSGDFLVIGCGRRERRKGFDMFIHTYAESVKRNSCANTVFMWIGPLPADQHEKEVATSLVQGLSVSPNNLILIDAVSSIEPFLHACDLYFLSSRHDPYPYSVLEACSIGTPVVLFSDATDIPLEYTNRLDPGSSIVLVEELCCHAALDAILSIQSDQQRCLSISTNPQPSPAILANSSAEIYLARLFELLEACNSICFACQDDCSIKFSIIVPLFKTNPRYLYELLASVANQSYGNWNLCLSASCLSDEARSIVCQFALTQPEGKVSVAFESEALGISENLNNAAKLACGHYLLFLDHDDLLYSSALRDLAQFIRKRDYPHFVYTDESLFSDQQESKLQVVRKRAFDHSLILEHNYITHLMCVSQKSFLSAGPFVSAYDGAQDYALVLKYLLAGFKPEYLPKTCYLWRQHEGSTSLSGSSKPYAHHAGRLALEDYLTHRGCVPFTVEDGPYLFTYKVSLSEDNEVRESR